MKKALTNKLDINIMLITNNKFVILITYDINKTLRRGEKYEKFKTL